MKITLVPSAYPGHASTQYLTSFVVNECVAFDAGSLGFYGGPKEQAAISHVFLSHTHLDHLASLPMFLENIFGKSKVPVTVHASEAVQLGLRRDLFNDRLWPNFLELAPGGIRFLQIETIEHGKTLNVEGLRITPVAVNHGLPTLGFIIEDDKTAIIIVSDTGPTQDIWDRANQTANLKAVFLEASFPDSMIQLAHVSNHLTPALFHAEVKKLHRPATVFAVHIKASFRTQVISELKDLGLPGVEVGQFGTPYEF